MKTLLIVLCLLVGQNTLAQAAAVGEANTTATRAAPSLLAPTGPSINPAANVGQQSQNAGSGANNAAGAALIAAGAAMMSNPPTVPAGLALMAMGMLALAQGSHDAGAAGQSGLTAVTTTSTTATPTGPATAVDGGMAAVLATPQGQQALAAAQSVGANLTPSGVTMPDGTTQPWSSFGSADSLNNAGFDSNSIMKTVAKVEKQVGDSGLKPSSSDGALAEGSTGGVRGPSSELPEFHFKPKNPLALSADQKAKMVAGKTILVGSEPIGVSMDNLFDMIHRAYEKKNQTDNFIR